MGHVIEFKFPPQTKRPCRIANQSTPMHSPELIEPVTISWVCRISTARLFTDAPARLANNKRIYK